MPPHLSPPAQHICPKKKPDALHVREFVIDIDLDIDIYILCVCASIYLYILCQRRFQVRLCTTTPVSETGNPMYALLPNRHPGTHSVQRRTAGENCRSYKDVYTNAQIYMTYIAKNAYIHLIIYMYTYLYIYIYIPAHWHKSCTIE